MSDQPDTDATDPDADPDMLQHRDLRGEHPVPIDAPDGDADADPGMLNPRDDRPAE